MVFWLFMSSSTDGKGASRAVTTERDSVRAKQVEVTNSSVCKLRRLTSVIKMKELNIKGSLRDDRGQHGSPDDVTQVSQTIVIINTNMARVNDVDNTQCSKSFKWLRYSLL